MKKRIKRIAQKSNRKLQEMTGRMEVNLMLPIAEVLTATQWHIEQLAGAAGMKIIQQIIEDDVRAALQSNSRIFVGKKTIITPSARVLGDANDVFVMQS